MLVSQLSTDASRADDIVKVKEEKKEKESSSSKGTPTKKKRKGILKSLISGPVSSAGWSRNLKEADNPVRWLVPTCRSYGLRF